MRQTQWYKLHHRKPVLCKFSMVDEPEKFAKECAYKTSNKVRVKYIGNVKISTVFLPINHAFNDSEPILFETMVFGPDNGAKLIARASTWREALNMHKKAVGLTKLHMKEAI
jgi:hypothetical protein